MNLIYLDDIEVKDYNMLRNEVGWEELPEQQAQTGLDNSRYVISCRVQGKTVGAARVIWDGGYIAFIADVMVSPKYQRKGIGMELVHRLMNCIYSQMKNGWSIMVVLVAAKGKEGFYKKLGFNERPNETLGAGMSQFIKFKDNK